MKHGGGLLRLSEISRLLHRRVGSSEVKLMVGDLHVLGLREFVPEGRDEFRVDFQRETLDLIGGFFKLRLGVSGEFLHMLVPAGRLAKLRSGKNQRGGSQLRRSELEKTSVEQADLKDVLAVEEDFLVLVGAIEHAVSLEETVGGWCGQNEAESLQNLLLHLEHLVFRELVLADGQKFAQLWRVDLLVLGCDQQCGDAEQVELALLDLYL